VKAEINYERAAYLWQQAFDELARVSHLSVPDALDLIGFPPVYLLEMGLVGDKIDETKREVEEQTSGKTPT
jgi:hypothetical protein